MTDGEVLVHFNPGTSEISLASSYHRHVKRCIDQFLFCVRHPHGLNSHEAKCLCCPTKEEADYNKRQGFVKNDEDILTKTSDALKLPLRIKLLGKSLPSHLKASLDIIEGHSKVLYECAKLESLCLTQPRMLCDQYRVLELLSPLYVIAASYLNTGEQTCCHKIVGFKVDLSQSIMANIMLYLKKITEVIVGEASNRLSYLRGRATNSKRTIIAALFPTKYKTTDRAMYEQMKKNIKPNGGTWRERDGSANPGQRVNPMVTRILNKICSDLASEPLPNTKLPLSSATDEEFFTFGFQFQLESRMSQSIVNSLMPEGRLDTSTLSNSEAPLSVEEVKSAKEEIDHLAKSFSWMVRQHLRNMKGWSPLECSDDPRSPLECSDDPPEPESKRHKKASS